MSQQEYIVQLENENSLLKSQLAKFSALPVESDENNGLPKDIQVIMELDHLENLGNNIPEGCLLRMQVEAELLEKDDNSWFEHLHLIYASPSWKEISSSPRVDAINNFAQSLHCIYPRDKVLIPEMQKCLVNNSLFIAEFRYYFSPNELRWAQISINPHHDGKWVVCEGYIINITKRKENEIELAAYRDELERLVKERTEEYEVTCEELKALNEELQFKNSLLHDEIKARVEVMRQLEYSESKMHSFVQQSLDGIMIFDQEGYVIEWNNAMEKITGFDRKDVLGMFEWEVRWQLYPEEHRTEFTLEELRNNRLQYMNDENKDLLEGLTMHTVDGSVKYIHASMFPIITKDSLLFGRIMRDATQQRDADIELSRYRSNLEQMVKIKTRELAIAKEKAEESDRLKSAFLANMSHEVRTPLNGIVGLLNILYADPDLPASIKEYIDIINSNSEILQRLINDILDIAKLEAKLMAIISEPVCIDDLMEEMEVIFQQQLNKLNKPELILENIKNRTGTVCVVFADPVRLRQIIHNLLSNALKFTDKGYIKFGYRIVADMLEIFVEDTGIGIPEEQLENIFERFRQAELGNNRRFGGTGLGLTISRNLAQLMGGEMYATSVEGEGTRFTFTISYKPCNME